MAKRAVDPKAAAAAAVAGGVVAAAGAAVGRLAAKKGEFRAYRLLEDEPLPEGLARIARGRLRHAGDQLSGASGQDRDAAVHEARKDMKKLRALLRLVRDELGRDTYRSENQTFRDVGRRLAGARDAAVMIETLDSLAERFPDSVPEGVAGPLRVALEAQRDSLQRETEGWAATVEEVTSTLKQARRRVEDWPLERDDWSAVEPGLRRMYRRGRRAFSVAEKDPSDENLHELRKRVKDLWYHLTILRFISPDAMETAGDEAHVLSDRLGDDHDLAVLREAGRDHAAILGGEDQRARFESAIHRRRADLQADALWLGRRLYAERPRDFARRLESYYRAAKGLDVSRAASAEAADH